MYDNDYYRFEDEDKANDTKKNLDNFNEQFTCPYIKFFSNRPPMCMIRQRNSFPPGPPPSKIPDKPKESKNDANLKFVDPRSIRQCLFKFVYIWPNRGNGFWMWLIHVGRRSITGYRWYRHRWVYFGMDLRQIGSFMCQ